MTVLRALLTGAAVLAATPVFAEGDPAHGKVVFNQCLVCHTIEPGKWKIGPSLYGVIGRHSASLPGYQYSQAMQKYNVTWSPETLEAYLPAPMKAVPGTKMTFAGLPNEKDRQDVIAYLETLK